MIVCFDEEEFMFKSEDVSAVKELYRDEEGNYNNKKVGKFWATEINISGHPYFLNYPMDVVLKKIGWK